MLQLPTRVSVSMKTVTFALLVGALAVSPLVTVNAQKGKPPTTSDSTVTVTFMNRPGDAMTSIGAAEYPGGVVHASSGDLRLDVGASGRVIQVALGATLVVGADVTDAPANMTYLTDAVLYIQNIRGVPVGSTETRVGRIGLGTAYPNHAVGFRATTSQGIEIYGTPVCVTRHTASTWAIASSACSADASDTAGLFEENLKGKINHRFKANYTVPFAVTVACTPDCP